VQSFRGTQLRPARGGLRINPGILLCGGIHVFDRALPTDKNTVVVIVVVRFVSNVTRLLLFSRRRRCGFLAACIFSII